jgi:transcriptional regulator with XRE-family HTH domain
MFSDHMAPHCDDTLGGRISLARGARKISVEEAAQQLGVLQSSWNAWERDRDVPRVNRLTMMAGILGVSPSWLLAGRGDGPLDETADRDQMDLLQAIRRISEDVAALNKRMRQLSLRLERKVDTAA